MTDPNITLSRKQKQILHFFVQKEEKENQTRNIDVLLSNETKAKHFFIWFSLPLQVPVTYSPSSIKSHCVISSYNKDSSLWKCETCLPHEKYILWILLYKLSLNYFCNQFCINYLNKERFKELLAFHFSEKDIPEVFLHSYKFESLYQQFF